MKPLNVGMIGYEQRFAHALADFLKGLKTGKPAMPDFGDAMRTQRIAMP